jgi:hypothetical protein
MLRAIRIICLLLLSVAAATSAPAQVIRHGNCIVESEFLPQCAVETRNGQEYVIQRYLRLLHYSGTPSLADAALPDAGWVYLNRQGRVVVRNVATMDNGANSFHHGLVRVTLGGKWGLANARGTLVVPLQYDGMLDYEPKIGWSACTGCHTLTGGEHSWFEGGDWVVLSRIGQVLRPSKESGSKQ